MIIFSCKKEIHTTNTQTALNLLKLAEDSLLTNRKFSSLCLDSAKKLTSNDEYIKCKIQLFELQRNLVLFQFDSVPHSFNSIQKCLSKQPYSNNHYELLAQFYNLKGVYFAQAFYNLDSAMYYFKLSLYNLKASDKQTMIPDIMINIADMYVRRGAFVDGIMFYRDALRLSDSLNIYQKISFPAHFGLGQAYFSGLKNFELADAFFKLAEKEYNTRNLSEKFTFCNNRGNFYYFRKDYNSALIWFRKAKALVLPGNYQFNIQLCNGNMGDVFLQLNQLDSAKIYLDESYDYFRNSENNTILNYLTTAKAGLALKLNNINLAGSFFSMFIDSISYEPDLLLIRYDYLQKYYEKKKDYKTAYQYKILESQLSDSLRPEWFNARIEEIEMRYKQDTALIKNQLLISKQTNTIQELKLTFRFWLMLLISIILALIFVFYFFYKRKQTLLQQYIFKISNLRMQNIRNRLSPHFIFNLLNSEISSEDDKRKHEKLIALTNLLRQSLMISEKGAIVLKEELDFVKTFVGIESAKLFPEFEFLIKIDQTEKVLNTNVPAMIIQIPIENALKHGLRSLNGHKKLSLDVHQLNNGIEILIIDNGVGLNVTNSIYNSGTGTGLKVVRQSVNLLNSKNKQQIIFEIKSRENGENGTFVRIFVPFEYNYDFN
jgi:Tfp pilus assembly protein PilF